MLVVKTIEASFAILKIITLVTIIKTLKCYYDGILETDIPNE